ncbi:hypothetical protein PINS_up013860 [Pythium insidiosum]|nr:hypothetical protein PINS_up013860 [Pythium insidiosum]
MSKIEKAGVEANVLLTSAPPSATPSPLKPTSEEGSATSSADSNEIRNADATADPLDDVKETAATTSVDAKAHALERELQGDCYAIEETNNNNDCSDTERSSHGPEEATPGDGEDVPDDGKDVEPSSVVEERAAVEEPSTEDESGAASEPLASESLASVPYAEPIADASAASSTPVESVDTIAEVSKEETGVVESVTLIDSVSALDSEECDEESDNSIDSIVNACMAELISTLERAEQEAKADAEEEEKCAVRATASTSLLLSESTEKPADTTLENRLESDAHTEMLHTSETSTGDSHAATAIDASAAEAGVRPATSEDGASTRAARASKRASRASKKQQRTQLDEQLEAEAMARCTCGAKCSIM